MENNQIVMEHPYVTRIKAAKPCVNSPTVTIRDVYQPAQGYIYEKLGFDEYIKINLK